MDPAKGHTVPFILVNSTWAYALEDIVLKAVEDQGMDFWWIDWQQGGPIAGCTGFKQNPTIWFAFLISLGFHSFFFLVNLNILPFALYDRTDHLRSTDHQRRGENLRGLVLARWGGLGTHRFGSYRNLF